MERVEGPVAAEEPLRIEVNGQEIAILMRSPGQEKELAVGFCLSEGVISDLDAIRLVHFCGSASPFDHDEENIDTGNRVEIRVDEAAWKPRPPGEAGRLIRSGCGAVPLQEVDLDLAALPDGPTVSLEVVLGLRQTMHRAQSAYSQYGGVHGAAIFDLAGQFVALGEDVGRHNAVDKAIGVCLLRGIPLEDKLILSTGRASYDMVSKAVRMGITIVLSISSATSLAVRLADLYHCTLGGYLRGGRLRLYTWPERIVLP
jgi:FdhD protein